jgi:hypothetical protein
MTPAADRAVWRYHHDAAFHAEVHRAVAVAEQELGARAHRVSGREFATLAAAVARDAVEHATIAGWQGPRRTGW